MFSPQKLFNPLRIFTRNTSKRPYIWYGEGIKYPGFTYYPRRPDIQDPPYEASKLFRVQRIKSLIGLPHWEKKIMQELKLDGKKRDVVILKNIPEVNRLLWRVKHVVEIVPITFPDGLPQGSRGTYLKENGELVVKKGLVPCERSLERTAGHREDPKRLDGATLKRDSDLKWLSGWSGSV